MLLGFVGAQCPAAAAQLGVRRFLSASFTDRHRNQEMKMTLKESLGFPALSLLLPCVLLFLQAGCATHPPTAASLQRLQGSWEGVLVGVEKEGTVSITITGNSLHFQGLRKDLWNDATFTLPAGTHPQQLRATITAADPAATNTLGVVVRAILKIGDGNLTLALNQDPDQEPPKRFGEGEPAVARYELWKVQKKKVEASTANATNQPPQTTADAQAPEHGRKHPAENAKIASGPDLFASPIAFQNNSTGVRKVYWLDKNGERKPYCELKPGEDCEIGTYLGHPWVVTEADGNALGLYFPDGQKRTVTLE